MRAKREEENKEGEEGCQRVRLIVAQDYSNNNSITLMVNGLLKKATDYLL